MAITESALAHAMARDFLRAVPPEAHVSRLWVWSQHGYIDPERDYVEFSAFVDLTSDDVDTAEKRLGKAVASLNDLYPEVNIMVYTLGPRVPGGRTPEQWVRPEAEEISLAE
jgi:hypothetical protein